MLSGNQNNTKVISTQKGAVTATEFSYYFQFTYEPHTYSFATYEQEGLKNRFKIIKADLSERFGINQFEDLDNPELVKKLVDFFNEKIIDLVGFDYDLTLTKKWAADQSDDNLKGGDNTKQLIKELSKRPGTALFIISDLNNGHYIKQNLTHWGLENYFPTIFCDVSEDRKISCFINYFQSYFMLDKDSFVNFSKADGILALNKAYLVDTSTSSKEIFSNSGIEHIQAEQSAHSINHLQRLNAIFFDNALEFKATSQSSPTTALESQKKYLDFLSLLETYAIAGEQDSFYFKNQGQMSFDIINNNDEGLWHYYHDKISHFTGDDYKNIFTNPTRVTEMNFQKQGHMLQTYLHLLAATQNLDTITLFRDAFQRHLTFAEYFTFKDTFKDMLNQADDFGNTPGHLLLGLGQKPMQTQLPSQKLIGFFLENGADLTLTNHKGKSYIDYLLELYNNSADPKLKEEALKQLASKNLYNIESSWFDNTDEDSDEECDTQASNPLKSLMADLHNPSNPDLEQTYQKIAYIFAKAESSKLTESVTTGWETKQTNTRFITLETYLEENVEHFKDEDEEQIRKYHAAFLEKFSEKQVVLPQTPSSTATGMFFAKSVQEGTSNITLSSTKRYADEDEDEDELRSSKKETRLK